MFTELLRRRRYFALASLITSSSPIAGCAGPAGGDVDTIEDSISDVAHTLVKRQSIGNCWLYAAATWAESMHMSATGQALNASESYWTYWHWFEQIVKGHVSGDAVQEGGYFSTALMLVKLYGVIGEGDFIPEEAEAEMSRRQLRARAAINESLKNGALKDPAARRDRALVRAELDKAFELSPEVIAQLDQVFGKDVGRNLTTRLGVTGELTASTEGTAIRRAKDVPAAYTAGPGLPMETRTLEDAANSWRQVSFPGPQAQRRAFEKRWQQALHDQQPVVITWFVDFNALDSEGRFLAPPATPGAQGSHMTVMEDYQAWAPGFGDLKAGEKETRPEALEALLSDEAKVEFIRVKNSWGSFQPTRAFSLTGYHDLYMAYLNGPVKQCAENDATRCWDNTPFEDVVLPPGY